MRGAAKGKENVQRLEAYLQALGQAGRPLPARDGKPNMSAIALACGFDRGVLYSNADAKVAIEQAAESLGLAAYEAPQERSPADDHRDRRIMKLEQENATMRAENIELRRRLKQLEHVEAHMIETGRRVVR